MSSTQVEVIENHRENSEVCTDPLVCMQKCLQLLDEINLPRGIFPLEDIVEAGRNDETGFIWLKQKKETDHYFKKIKRTVTYAVEDRRLKNITGVKTKELSFTVNVSDIRIKDPESNKITFAMPSGIKRTFPVSAFEVEENKEEENKDEGEEEEKKMEENKEDRNEVEEKKVEEIKDEKEEEKKKEEHEDEKDKNILF